MLFSLQLQLYQIFGFLAFSLPLSVTHHCTTYNAGIEVRVHTDVLKIGGGIGIFLFHKID
jgi:hypothetical protein